LQPIDTVTFQIVEILGQTHGPLKDNSTESTSRGLSQNSASRLDRSAIDARVSARFSAKVQLTGNRR